jgi:hypothetical protein
MAFIHILPEAVEQYQDWAHAQEEKEAESSHRLLKSVFLMMGRQLSNGTSNMAANTT